MVHCVLWDGRGRANHGNRIAEKLGADRAGRRELVARLIEQVHLPETDGPRQRAEDVAGLVEQARFGQSARDVALHQRGDHEQRPAVVRSVGVHRDDTSDDGDTPVPVSRCPDRVKPSSSTMYTSGTAATTIVVVS